MNRDNFEPPLDIDPPKGATWEGEWELVRIWDTSMAMDDPGEPGWSRWYLEHDGHEKCCHHSWPAYQPAVLVGRVSPDA